MLSRRRLALGAALAPFAPFAPSAARAAGPLPLFDAHIHYSHDAWAPFPPEQALGILRAAGLRGVLMSSSDDEGQQRLIALAPELIVSELRPYRRRSDAQGWTRDEGVLGYVEERLARHRYVGLGEFHVSGADADLPVPRRLVSIARRQGLLMHAHSNVEAIDRLFAQWPQARILWAHAGFEDVATVAAALRRHPRLWADLSFRDPARGGRVEPAWRELFAAFPERFMVGTDTYTPQRWGHVVEHARGAREWLTDLPAAQAERLAWRNAETLLRG